jgi:PAS domain S-box-containing protein
MLTILYVDDEDVLLSVAKAFLEKDGQFSVDTISSAPAALTRLKSKGYDAIISDYQMPVMDGIEFLKRVRGSGNTVPFILFTGRGREEVVIQALNEGADYYLQKGGDPRSQFVELTHKLRQAIQVRRAESALEESEERYRAVVEDQTELICRFTPGGRLTFVNDAYCRYFGLDKNQCIGKPHPVQLPPEDARNMQQHLASLNPENPVALIEHRIRMPDGTIRWQRWNDRAIFNKDAHVAEYQSVGRDISRQKKADEKLHESESRFAAFMNNLPVSMFIKDDQSTTLFVNNKMEAFFGARQWIGRPTRDLFPADAAEKMVADDQKTIRDGHMETVETLPVKSGDLRTFETHKFRIDRGDNSPLIGGFAIDITERMRVEQDLKESEARLHLALSASDTGMWEVDIPTMTGKIDEQAAHILGYRKEDVGSDLTDWDALSHPDDVPKISGRLTDYLEGRTPVFESEHRMHHASGEWVWIVGKGKITHRLPDGSPLRISGTLQDITKRKQAEENLLALRDLSAMFLSSHSLDEVLLSCLETAIRLSHMDCGGIYLVNQHTRDLDLVVSTGFSPDFIADVLHIPAGSGSAQIVYAKKPVYTSYAELGTMISPSRKREGLRSIAIVPILHHDEVIACFNISSHTQDSILPESRNILEMIAAHVGNAIGRILSEQSLKESGAEFREFFNNASDAIVIHDMHGHFMAVNDEICRRLGYSREEMLKMHPGDIDEPVYGDKVKERIDTLQRTGQIIFETVHHAKDGTRIPTEVSSRVITYRGQPGIMSTGRDITERKRAEEELRLSEEKFSDVFLKNPVPLTLVSADTGLFADVNVAFLRSTGYDRADVIGKTAQELGLFEDPEGYARLVAELRSGHSVSGMEIRCRNRNGALGTCRFSSGLVFLNGRPHILSTVEDVTERKRAEEAERESEERFRLIFNTSSDAMLVHRISGDKEPGQIVEVNETMCRRYGYSREELLQMRPQDIDAPEGLEIAIRDVLQKLATEGHATWEGVHKTKDGKKFPVEIANTVFEYKGERVALAIARDITERKRAENAVRESEALLRQVTESISSVFYIYDHVSNEFIYVSPAYEKVWKKPCEELLRNPYSYFESVHPEDRANLMGSIRLEQEEKRFVDTEYRILQPDGTVRRIHSRNFPVPESDGAANRVAGIAEDITERKRAEDTLRKANRQLTMMTSLTRHDINNQILALLSYLDLAKASSTNHKMDEFIRKLKAVTKTIQSQIAFTKVYQDLGSNEPRWLDVDSVLATLQVPAPVTLMSDVHGLEIYADAMLERVFYNLLDNSLRHGQHVTAIRVSFILSAEGLIISWEDNGAGVVADEKELIFEQGFGKNTGLGLFLVREILDITGISIRETGEPGKGARFEITVPDGTWRAVEKK